MPVINGLNYPDKIKLKVLVVTGSSGGHIFPALAFLEAIKEQHPDIEVFFVLPEKNVIKENVRFNYEVKYVKLCAITRRVDAKNIRNILNFISGSLQTLNVLLKFQPDIVVGFGSLVTFPAIMFAWLLRIKILIHEQNVIPGRANRFLAGFVDKVAVSFQETKAYLADYKRKIVVTGNPLRKSVAYSDKIKAFDFFGFGPDKFTILVMGGSLGSHRINKEFFKALSCFKDRDLLQVIHLTGAFDYEMLNSQYKDLGVKCAVFRFFDSMQYAYSVSDLVISRAGATAVAEIIFFNLPAILVPYPYAYQHQYKNAKVLEENGCGIIIEDKEFEADNLRLKLEPLLRDRKKIEAMRLNYNVFPKVNAGDLLVKEVMAMN